MWFMSLMIPGLWVVLKICLTVCLTDVGMIIMGLQCWIFRGERKLGVMLHWHMSQSRESNFFEWDEYYVALFNINILGEDTFLEITSRYDS